MAIRIWHQSLVDFGSAPAYKAALQEHAQRVALPDTEVVLHGVPTGAYGEWGVETAARHVYLAHLMRTQLLDKVLEAERLGFDAFAIVTLQDPGLREARALVDLPVVGYGETAMHLACMLGDKFGVVAFNPPLFPLWADQVRERGFMERFAGVVEVSVGYESITEAFEEPQPILEAFTEAANECISRGADVVIPGQALLGQLLATAGCSRVSDVPVIDPLAVTIKQAEMMVQLKRLCGLQSCRRGYFYAIPPRELAHQLRRSLAVPKTTEEEEQR